MMTPNEVRRLSLSMPETEERETWGEATFRVKDKIFATVGASGEEAGVKTDKANQSILVRTKPDVFSISHYVGRFGWVTVKLEHVDDALMRDLIIESWRSIAPKTLVKQYDATTGGGVAAPAPKRTPVRKPAKKAAKAAKRPAKKASAKKKPAKKSSR